MTEISTLCQVPNCQKPIKARQLCAMHYARLMRRGSLAEPPVRSFTDARERFWSRIEEAAEGCWLWTGGKTSAGYGMLLHKGVKTYAHRYAYEELVGPVPSGLELDHLCSRRACVNPAHLEPVPHAVNCRRRSERTQRQACPSGHVLAGDNLLIESTKFGTTRRCRTCRRIWDRKIRERRKAARSLS